MLFTGHSKEVGIEAHKCYWTHFLSQRSIFNGSPIMIKIFFSNTGGRVGILCFPTETAVPGLNPGGAQELWKLQLSAKTKLDVQLFSNLFISLCLSSFLAQPSSITRLFFLLLNSFACCSKLTNDSSVSVHNPISIGTKSSIRSWCFACWPVEEKGTKVFGPGF